MDRIPPAGVLARVMSPVRPKSVMRCLALLAAFAAAAPAVAAPTHHHHGHHRHHHSIDRSGRPRVGLASYYGTHAAGRKTASGKRLAPGHLTAASRTLPLGTKAKVVNKDTGKSVKVTVTDRGPFVKSRILDVSPTAARKLGVKHDGLAKVRVQPLKLPPRREEQASR